MNKHYSGMFEKPAQTNVKKMDTNDARIIMAWIHKNLGNCQNPYVQGKAFQGNLQRKWRYRVGNYRLIANIDTENVIIVVLVIGHRREIYK